MTWRRGILIGLTCILLVGGAVELLHRWKQNHSAEAIERRAGLDSRIAKLDWNDLSPQAAADQLSRVTGAHIEIIGPCLEYTPYNRRRVTIHSHLHDVKFSTAVDILCSLMPTGTTAEETYEVQPDGTITLLPDSLAKRIYRIYDVHDLLDDPAAWPRAYQPLEKLLLWNTNERTPTTVRIAGKWAVFATLQEHSRTDAVLTALRSPSAGLDASDQTAEALGRMVGPIHVRGVPVEKGIDTLAEQAGVNLVVDWTSVEIWDVNVPVSADVERLPLGAALNIFLKRPAVYSTDDNVLLVMSEIPPISFREARAYELSDLIGAFAARLKADDARRAGHEPTTPSSYYTAPATSLLEDIMTRSTISRYHAGSDEWLGTRYLLAGPSDGHLELRRVFTTLRQFVKESAENAPAEPRFLSDCNEVFARLHATISEVSLDHASLPTALTALQSSAGVTIGFDRDMDFDRLSIRPITLHLWNVPLSVALHEVLKAASGGTPLGYSINRGVIIVSANPYLWTAARIYDVSDFARDPSAQTDQLPKLINRTIESTA